MHRCAVVAELVDAEHLKCTGISREGSSPSVRTIILTSNNMEVSLLETTNSLLTDWSLLVYGYWVMLMPLIVAWMFLSLLLREVRLHWRRFTSRRGRVTKMTDREREEMVKRLLGDVVTDCMQDLEYRGLISFEDMQKWYSRLGNHCHLGTLLPRKVQDLKAQMQHKKELRNKAKQEPKIEKPKKHFMTR